MLILFIFHAKTATDFNKNAYCVTLKLLLLCMFIMKAYNCIVASIAILQFTFSKLDDTTS